MQWNSYSKNFILNSCTLLIFPALEIKKQVFVGKMLRYFAITLHTWLLHMLFYSIFLINCLYKMIEILQEEMLTGIYLYWFHYTSQENNSPNGHSNGPWIDGSSSYLMSTKILLIKHLHDKIKAIFNMKVQNNIFDIIFCWYVMLIETFYMYK